MGSACSAATGSPRSSDARVWHLPIDAGESYLDGLVARGLATPPTVTGPFPMPAVLGDPNINVAEELAAAREEERW